MIARIHIRNYKSFSEEIVEGFSAANNLLIGLNGHGKSNLYGAIRFAITPTDRASVTADEKRALLNERLVDAELFVALTLSNAGDRFPLKAAEISFKKQIGVDNRLSHYINDLALPAEEYYSLLECGSVGRLLGLARPDGFAALDGADVFQLLKEITGARVYERKRAEAVAVMEKAAAEERVARRRLADFEIVLSKLQRNQKDYAAHLRAARTINGIEAELTRRRMAQLAARLAEAREAAAAQREEVLGAQKALVEAQIAAEAFSARESAVPPTDERERETRHRRAGESAAGDFARTAARRAELETAVRAAETELEAAIVEETRLRGRLAPPRPTDVAALERTRERLFVEAGQLKEELTAANAERAEAERALTELIGESAQLRSQGNDRAIVAAKLRAQLSAIEERKAEIARGFAPNSLRPAQLELLAALRLVSAFRAENADELCFLVAELLDVPPRLEPAVEAVAGRRLAAAVVRDEAAALRLLDENARRGGARLRVFPLSWLGGARERAIGNTEAVSLREAVRLKDSHAITALCSFNAGETLLVSALNESIVEGWREARPLIESLLDELFGRALLVKTRAAAMALSRELRADCVTADGEVVFAGGFAARLGSLGAQRSLLSAFGAQVEAAALLAAEAENAARVGALLAAAESERANAETVTTKAFGGLAAREAQLKMLETHALSLRDALFNRTRELAETDLVLVGASSAGSPSESSARLRERLARAEQRRAQLERRRENALRALREIEWRGVPPTEPPRAAPIAPRATATTHRAERAAQEAARRLDALLAHSQQLEQTVKRLAEKRAALLSDATDAAECERAESEALLRRLAELVARAKGSFTERDSAIFKQLTSFEEKRRAFGAQLERIDGGRQRLFDCIGRVDQRVSEVSESFFHVFKAHFQRFYARFEPAFEVEPSLRALAPRAGDSQRYAVEFAIAAKGGGHTADGLFSFAGAVSRAQLSRGKRLVFFLCLLLAFDAIEPSPFYLFDEFDSALDGENLGAYVRALTYLSQRAQVFFTSFRSAVLNIDGMHISEVYFDGESHVRKVEYERANEIFESVRCSTRNRFS